MDFVGIEKLSLVDYDGKLTCTLFMAGCNFRCPFCHNADLVLDTYNCTPIPFQDILEYLESKKGKLEAVCITGGEPTLMRDLKEKITVIKNMGYLVKLDTNGTNLKVVKDLVENKLIDYVAMDIKNSEKDYHLAIGLNYQPFSKIKETIDYLMACGIDYEFRTTLVKDIHDERNIKEMGELIKGAKKLFLQKFVDSGRTIKKGCEAITVEQARRFQEILSKYVDKVELRGY